MNWWMIALILGAIGTGILTGLKTGSVWQGVNKGFPLFSLHNSLKAGEHERTSMVYVAESQQETTVIEKPFNILESIAKEIPMIPVETPLIPIKEQSLDVREYGEEVFIELEHNLELAEKTLNGQLEVFETAVWDNKRNEFEMIDPERKWLITQAYTEMFLANNIVRLSNELGGDNGAMSSSYLELKSKIAEKLQRVLPVKTA
jgi:hypothetical protein